MNKFFLLVCMLAFSAISIISKAQSPQKEDSLTSFRVAGVCEQCKHRIEKALKIKGIKKAEWDVETKMLSVVYNPSKISIEKVHSRLAGVGHDTELKKSKE